MKLTLLAASPMYYQVPVYKRLARLVDFHVVYASTAGLRAHDAGYGRDITWDYPLLEGYSSEFLRRANRNTLPDRPTDLRDWDVATVVRKRRGVWWLHGYNTLTHAFARLAIAQMGLPGLIREEQNSLSERPRLRRFLKRVGLPAFLRGAEAVYIGKNNQEWLRRYGIPEERMHWAPYTVDNAMFSSVADSLQPRREALRRAAGYGSDNVVFLAVMRLIEKKQPVQVVEAFSLAHRTDPRLRLRIVGDGPLRAKVTSRVQALGLEGSVSLTGFRGQTEVTHDYAMSDAFVLFSGFDETWGLVVNEAMLFALPVIVSDRVGSAPDLVVEGVNGAVVHHGDIAGMSQRLLTLGADRKLRQQMGAAARTHIEQFNPDVTAKGILSAAVAAARRKDPKFGGTDSPYAH